MIISVSLSSRLMVLVTTDCSTIWGVWSKRMIGTMVVRALDLGDEKTRCVDKEGADYLDASLLRWMERYG